MKPIEALNVWTAGVIKTANRFKLKSTYDNLESEANFHYELLEEPTPGSLQVVANGNLSIDSTAYTTWKADADTNEYAYTWAADQLNLVIDTTP